MTKIPASMSIFLPSCIPGINVKGWEGAGPPNGTTPRQHLGVALSRVSFPPSRSLSLSSSLSRASLVAWLLEALANSISFKDSVRVSLPTRGFYISPYAATHLELVAVTGMAMVMCGELVAMAAACWWKFQWPFSIDSSIVSMAYQWRLWGRWICRECYCGPYESEFFAICAVFLWTTGQHRQHVWRGMNVRRCQQAREKFR